MGLRFQGGPVKNKRSPQVSEEPDSFHSHKGMKHCCACRTAAVCSEKGSREQQTGEPVAYSHVQRGQVHLCSCNQRDPGTSRHQLLLPLWHLRPEAKSNINCTFALQARGVKASTWNNGVRGCAHQCPGPLQILTAT